jgi:osmotically-inducible protein OsmY
MTTYGDTTDRELKASVVQELVRATGVDSTVLGVTVVDGVATLFGVVGSHAEKVAATEAVLRVEGVRALAQEVQIRTAWSQVTDADIARDAESALEQDENLPDTIDLVVDHRVVTLHGTVRAAFERDAAERTVFRVTGVQGVIDRTVLDRAATQDGPLDLVQPHVRPLST